MTLEPWWIYDAQLDELEPGTVWSDHETRFVNLPGSDELCTLDGNRFHLVHPIQPPHGDVDE